MKRLDSSVLQLSSLITGRGAPTDFFSFFWAFTLPPPHRGLPQLARGRSGSDAAWYGTKRAGGWHQSAAPAPLLLRRPSVRPLRGLPIPPRWVFPRTSPLLLCACACA